MPQYAYRAKRDVSTEAQGVIDARDLSGAVSALKAQGLYPLDVHPIAAPTTPSAITSLPTAPARALGAATLALWARTLAQGLHGGLTLTQALHLLVEQEGTGPLGAMAAQLRSWVTQGQPLSQAMTAVGGFPPMTVALVRAGEASGSLEQALSRMAQSAERHAELSGKVRAALAYPALILVVGTATTLVLVTFVVPQLAKLFTELGQPLPWPTRLMLAARRGLGWIAVVGIAGLLVARAAIRQMGERVRWRDQMRRAAGAIPVIGPVLYKAELAGWSQTLGLMVGQGVSLPEAVALATQTMGDAGLRQRLSRLETDVLEGLPLSEGLRRSGITAPLLVTMTAIGEAEGALADSLLNVAAAFERDVDHGVKVVSSLLEPMLILLVGLVVAAIVFSMLLPIFQINFTAS